jgi:hypothetical protein
MAAIRGSTFPEVKLQDGSDVGETGVYELYR